MFAETKYQLMETTFATDREHVITYIISIYPGPGPPMYRSRRLAGTQLNPR